MFLILFFFGQKSMENLSDFFSICSSLILRTEIRCGDHSLLERTVGMYAIRLRIEVPDMTLWFLPEIIEKVFVSQKCSI